MSDQGRPTQRRVKPGQARSSGAIQQRRVPRAWPADRRFRILSIDGGGIRGIFPAAVLAGLERAYTSGNPIASYFDLVAGTSTGGIIALGLGAGLGADQLLDLYVRRGGEAFPQLTTSDRVFDEFGGSHDTELGPPNVVRVDLPAFELPIEMDDWRRSVDLLVPAAEAFTQLKVSNS